MVVHDMLRVPAWSPTERQSAAILQQWAIGPGSKPRTAEATVYIVDPDDASVRAVRTLAVKHKVPVVVCSSAEEFWDLLPREHCGCVVLEVDLPGMTGLMLQDRLRECGITLPVVMLAAQGDVTVAVEAMRNGAIDFLQKPWHAHALWEAIQLALQKDRLHRSRQWALADVQGRIDTLTDEERLVMQLLLQEVPKKSIVRRVKVSTRTLDFRRANILRKMRVSSLIELAQLLAVFDDPPVLSGHSVPVHSLPGLQVFDKLPGSRVQRNHN
jgi:FixJ family two-component response regulator